MTDINKQIEEARECRQKLIQKIRLNKANVDYILENGLINGSLMLDIDKAMIDYHAYSSRWRKVSEELPELGIEVIITRNDGIRFLAWLDKDSELFFNVSENEEYFLDEIQSWKPID